MGQNSREAEISVDDPEDQEKPRGIITRNPVLGSPLVARVSRGLAEFRTEGPREGEFLIGSEGAEPEKGTDAEVPDAAT